MFNLIYNYNAACEFSVFDNTKFK